MTWTSLAMGRATAFSDTSSISPSAFRKPHCQAGRCRGQTFPSAKRAGAGLSWHSRATCPRRIHPSRPGMRTRVGEDKTQPLISLWINCQACPRGALVWGFGADKQHLRLPGDTRHDSSGASERSSQACPRHPERRGCFSGTQTPLTRSAERAANLRQIGVVSPASGCIPSESKKCETTLESLHSCLDLQRGKALRGNTG